MYYASFGILAFVLHVIVNFDVLFKNDYKDVLEANREYRVFLFSTLFFYVSDILWGVFYELQWMSLCYADTVGYFFCLGLTVFLWTRYVIAYVHDEKTFSTFLNFAGGVIFLYQITFLIYNYYRPVVFEFDANNVFVAKPSRYIMLSFQVGLFFAVFLFTLIYVIRGKGKWKLHYRTISVTCLMLGAFSLIQVAYPLLPFNSIGLMLGTSLLHTFVLEDEKRDQRRELQEALYREKNQRHELEETRKMAYMDSLTGVKNKHALFEKEQSIDMQILEGDISEFAVVAFDLNNLKEINDTLGHEEGDRYIQNGCRMICKTFQHSPVYRIGGDEFVAVLEGEDYQNRKILLRAFDAQVEENQTQHDVVIASGMVEYHPGVDLTFEAVFDQADHKMYERKTALKSMAQGMD